MNKQTILSRIKENKEIIDLNTNSILGLQKDINHYSKVMDKEGFTPKGYYAPNTIETNKNMIKQRKEDNKKLHKETEELRAKVDLMLKYFNVDKPLMQLGRILKLLSKEYNNPFKSDSFKPYTLELWEIINYAIDNNKRFYLQFKTLEKECLKVYDSDLKRWV